MTAFTTSHSRARRRPIGTTGHDRASLMALVAVGLLMEAVLIAGWLVPLSLWRTPTNLPAGTPMVLIFGQDAAGALRFALPAVLLSLGWGAALWLAARLRQRTAMLAVGGFAVLFFVTLVPMNPGGTQDIYHNIADGRLFWRYAVNPTLTPPSAFPEDPFYRHVWGYTDLPSAYGPLWYVLDGLPTGLAGDGLVANVVAQKTLVSLFMLGTVLLTVLTARAVAPERTVFAIVLGGWSPLFVFESAGNGHNDSVMAFFLAAALLAAARRAYLWVLPLLALSVLVKYTTLLIVPLALVWFLRNPDVSKRTVAAGTGIAVSLLVLFFAPMYAGWDTFAARHAAASTFILSPATLLHGFLAGWLAEHDASRLARGLTGAGFAALYLVTLARTRGDVRQLMAGGFDALFGYLLLASWWFWPWYLTWLVPVAALCRGWTRPTAFAAFAVAALLTYLYWWPDPAWRSTGWFVAYGTITLGVFLIPAAAWAIALLRHPPREARRLHGER